MSAAFPYSLRSLNDNWFEDRLQPEGASRGCGPLDQKKVRPIEAEIAHVGERYDPLTRVARCPHRESYASPNDGFNEKTTMNKGDFVHPRSRKEVVVNPPPKPVFITTETIPEVCYESRRPVPGKNKGFGAVLNRHEENHEQRFWNTTVEDTFGPGPAGARRPQVKLDAHPMKPSGVSILDQAGRAEGVLVGQLCGEDYKKVADPSADTHIQRAWLYNRDPALVNIHHGGQKPRIPGVDNETSLKLGEGQHVKTMSQLSARGGMLFRTATQITKGKGERYGLSIFQDE